MPRHLRSLSDGAALLECSNAEALALAASLVEQRPDGFLDAVPGARTLLVLFDPDRFDPEPLAHAAADARVRTPRTVRLPTLYDGADLDAFSIPRDEVVRLHAGADYTVAFLGFAPGFAYLAGAPRELSVPRLRTPRVRVPAGSVAVADGYSGIYPVECPGGWRLLGRVAARLFDPAASPPSLLQPGDHVVFEPAASLEAPGPARDGERLRARAQQGEPVLRVVSPGPFTSVQGAPRYGLSASGVPAGGAMDLPLLAAANALLGNAPGAPGLEITVLGPELEALLPVRLALSRGEVRELRPGERLKTGPVRSGVREYLCLDGGFAQPLPGEPTLPLRAGALLCRSAAPHNRALASAGTAPRASTVAPVALVLRPAPRLFSGLVRAVPGPQLDTFSPASIETFFSCEFRVSAQSDRRGLRLQGPPLELTGSADLPPEGTAPGAVQVPGDGLPIVLGPDRPVTGGYPKIATVISADLPLLAQARPGAVLRFRRVTLAEALAARRSS